MTDAASTTKLIQAAERFLGKGEKALSPRERQVLKQAIGKRVLSQDASAIFDENRRSESGWPMALRHLAGPGRS